MTCATLKKPSETQITEALTQAINQAFAGSCDLSLYSHDEQEEMRGYFCLIISDMLGIYMTDEDVLKSSSFEELQNALIARLNLENQEDEAAQKRHAEMNG